MYDSIIWVRYNQSAKEETYGTQKIDNSQYTLIFSNLFNSGIYMDVLCEAGLYMDGNHTGCVGVTDMADGFIARRFHMTSDLGKILDPVADKLTQATVLFCLVTRFPLMLVPLALLVLKEIVVGSTGLLVIKRTGKVHGAKWHGKVATALLDAMMVMHVLWYNIPDNVSKVSIVCCIVMMAVSLVLYGTRNVKALKEA